MEALRNVSVIEVDNNYLILSHSKSTIDKLTDIVNN